MFILLCYLLFLCNSSWNLLAISEWFFSFCFSTIFKWNMKLTPFYSGKIDSVSFTFCFWVKYVMLSWQCRQTDLIWKSLYFHACYIKSPWHYIIFLKSLLYLLVKWISQWVINKVFKKSCILCDVEFYWRYVRRKGNFTI